MASFIEHVERELKPALGQRKTEMPVEPVGARSATINVNSIFGGQPIDGVQTPCVADVCRAIFDRRFLLEENFEDVRGELVELLAQLQTNDEDFRYELKDLMIVHPTMTAPESELVRTMASAIVSSVGKQPPLIASPGTYDQKHFARIAGIEQCIAYGPGILNLAHQPDEYCEIEHLILSCKAMALATLRLLGA
jgi:succinyl-diaminopimelate desuccinylase